MLLANWQLQPGSTWPLIRQVLSATPPPALAFRGHEPSEGGRETGWEAGREGGRGSAAPAAANADFMLRGSTSVWSRFKTVQANERSALAASGAVSASTLGPPLGHGSEPDAFWSANVNNGCWEGGGGFVVPWVPSCEVNLGRDESGGPGGGRSMGNQSEPEIFGGKKAGKRPQMRPQKTRPWFRFSRRS